MPLALLSGMTSLQLVCPVKVLDVPLSLALRDHGSIRMVKRQHIGSDQHVDYIVQYEGFPVHICETHD